MCKCGCGTCETKITGPLLTESKVKSLLSEGLNHHISNAIPLHETVYRYGSVKHLSLIKEARKLYSRNVIDLNEFDVELVKTHLGEWGLFENESVPLDLPMLNEAYYEVAADLGDKKAKENLDSFEEVQDFMDKMAKRNAISVDVTKFDKDKKQTIKYNWTGNKWEQASKSDINESELEEAEFKGKDVPMLEQTYSGFRRGEPEDPDSIPFKPTGSVSEFREDLRALFGKFKGDLKNPDFIKGVAQIMVNWKSLLRSQLDEAKKAKKKKKDPPIGKPKRGGSKAYYVYVRDPKTKKIKKVSFGSGGLRAKINNPKARNAFAKRHRCSTKNDRTKPGYWSCRLPRYAKALGLGNNKNTFW